MNDRQRKHEDRARLVHQREADRTIEQADLRTLIFLEDQGAPFFGPHKEKPLTTVADERISRADQASFDYESVSPVRQRKRLSWDRREARRIREYLTEY